MDEKLTVSDVLNWLGEEGTTEDLAEYLCSILNKEFDVDSALKEIKDYNEE